MLPQTEGWAWCLEQPQSLGTHETTFHTQADMHAAA